jgi:hypothetical protein
MVDVVVLRPFSLMVRTFRGVTDDHRNGCSRGRFGMGHVASYRTQHLNREGHEKKQELETGSAHLQIFRIFSLVVKAENDFTGKSYLPFPRISQPALTFGISGSRTAHRWLTFDELLGAASASRPPKKN